MRPRPTHPLSLRLLAGALALWLAPVLLDAPGLDACPMHDGARASSAQGMAGMAGMVGGAVAPPGTAGRHAHDAHVHGCTCLGACALAGAIPAPVGVGVAPRSPIMVSTAVPMARVVLARGAGAHFLPFAHAPPLPS